MDAKKAASPQSDVFLFVCLFFVVVFFFVRDVAVEQRKFFVVSSKCANCEERFFSSVLHLPPS